LEPIADENRLIRRVVKRVHVDATVAVVDDIPDNLMASLEPTEQRVHQEPHSELGISLMAWMKVLCLVPDQSVRTVANQEPPTVWFPVIPPSAIKGDDIESPFDVEYPPVSVSTSVRSPPVGSSKVADEPRLSTAAVLTDASGTFSGKIVCPELIDRVRSRSMKQVFELTAFYERLPR
jgi:hypothetical protein